MNCKTSDPSPGLLPLLRGMRKCTGLPESLQALAEAVGLLCNAESTGVFLLDESKSQILLFASWSSANGRREEKQQPLDLSLQEDPLCFCLQTGAPYRARLSAPPCLQVLGSNAENCVAFPLIGGGNVTMGGVLVAASQRPADSAVRDGEQMCAYGALLFDALLQKKRDSSLLQSLRDDLHMIEEQRENAASPVLNRILGQSAGIRHVRDLILRAAPTEASILVTGETGTGKELVADAVHFLSKRRSGPFLKVNCAAIPAQLLESELFGYRKGAFSGAVSDSKGLLRSADNGTLLLDEIGDMPPELQVKLLRFLQDQQVRPVGDVRSFPVSIRIVAATNSNLQDAMNRGRFRNDLYHRLAAFQIHIPPLRERPEDILPLVDHYLRQLSAQYGRDPVSLPPQTLMSLTSHHFPGNVRELINMLESAIVSSGTQCLEPRGIFSSPGRDERRMWKMDLKTHLDNMEQSIIAYTLAHFNGNASKAAGALGLPRSTLTSKLRKNPAEEAMGLLGQERQKDERAGRGRGK